MATLLDPKHITIGLVLLLLPPFMLGSELAISLEGKVASSTHVAVIAVEKVVLGKILKRKDESSRTQEVTIKASVEECILGKTGKAIVFTCFSASFRDGEWSVYSTAGFSAYGVREKTRYIAYLKKKGDSYFLAGNSNQYLERIGGERVRDIGQTGRTVPLKDKLLALRATAKRRQAAALRMEAELLRAEAHKLQGQAIIGLKEYLKNHPQDPVYAAHCLLRLGTIYLKRSEYDEADRWFDRLRKEYPKSPLVKVLESVPSRGLMKVSDAEALAERMIAEITDMPFKCVAFLASSLFGDNERGEPSCLNPKLAMSGLNEVIRRAGDDAHPDQKQAAAMLTEAEFGKAQLHYISGSFEKCVKQCDLLLKNNPGRVTRFRLLVLKAKAYRDNGKVKESLKCFEEAFIDGSKPRYDYSDAVVESGFTLMLLDTKESAQRAYFRFSEIVDSARDTDDSKVHLAVQRAYLGLIRCGVRLDMQKEADKHRASFMKKYPKSPFMEDLKRKAK